MSANVFTLPLVLYLQWVSDIIKCTKRQLQYQNHAPLPPKHTQIPKLGYTYCGYRHFSNLTQAAIKQMTNENSIWKTNIKLLCRWKNFICFLNNFNYLIIMNMGNSYLTNIFLPIGWRCPSWLEFND